MAAGSLKQSVCVVVGFGSNDAAGHLRNSPSRADTLAHHIIYPHDISGSGAGEPLFGGAALNEMLSDSVIQRFFIDKR